jgi:predicted nucleic acid-binding Zn ribbon protein
MENRKSCFHCGKPVQGRSDKKFCANHCRSEYNNRKNKTQENNSSIIRIHRILQHNRSILYRLMEKGDRGCVSVEMLVELGFHFGFHTHIVTIKNKTKVFCYDIGYLKKNEREVFIYCPDKN